MTSRVLIVEDDLALRPFWELILRRQFNEYHLDWAISCEEAERLIASSVKYDSTYCLIVTDLFLAGAATGLDLVHFIGKNQEHTPLVMVSSADEEAIRNSYRDSVKDIHVISKPLSVPKIERVLEKLFSLELSPRPSGGEVWQGLSSRNRKSS